MSAIDAFFEGNLFNALLGAAVLLALVIYLIYRVLVILDWW